MLVVSGVAERLQRIHVAALCRIYVAVNLPKRRPAAGRVVHLRLEGVKHRGIRIGDADEVILRIAHRLHCGGNFGISRAAGHGRKHYAKARRRLFTVNRPAQIEREQNTVAKRALVARRERADRSRSRRSNRQVLLPRNGVGKSLRDNTGLRAFCYGDLHARTANVEAQGTGFSRLSGESHLCRGGYGVRHVSERNANKLAEAIDRAIGDHHTGQLRPAAEKLLGHGRGRHRHRLTGFSRARIEHLADQEALSALRRRECRGIVYLGIKKRHSNAARDGVERNTHRFTFKVASIWLSG